MSPDGGAVDGGRAPAPRSWPGPRLWWPYGRGDAPAQIARILGGHQEPPKALPLLTIALWATPAHGGPLDTELECKTDPNGETPQPATQV